MGRITRAHGVRGEVAVRTLTEVASRFEPGSVLLLGPDGTRSLTVASARTHQDRLLVRFEEVADRTEAEILRGSLLLVRSSETPRRPEGGFWVHEVVGLEVVTEGGRALGTVTEVLSSPANDVWATDRGALVPALRDFVRDVDLEARRVLVREVPGLWEDGEP